MIALCLDAPKTWKQIDVPEPGDPRPGEAVVRVHRVGVCGTDISGYLGKMPLFSYPRIPGHELGVEVVAVGPGVSNVAIGDRCSVEPYINCERCHACRRGHTNCCEKLEVLGVHCDGGLRPLFTVPARKLHRSTRLSQEQLALVETLAIGCHAVNRSGLQANETCLIIGAGPIGLATLEFVKLTGAKVVLLDVNDARLEFCRSTMGVAHTLKPSDRLDSELREIADGHLPDVVIDATGSPASMQASFGLIAQHGRLVFVGIAPGEVTFKHAIFHKAEGTLLCSRNAVADDFTRIISLIEAGRIDTRPWITHRVAFEGVIDAFPSFANPETGVIKAVIALDE